jgi:hypothetical protein
MVLAGGQLISTGGCPIFGCPRGGMLARHHIARVTPTRCLRSDLLRRGVSFLDRVEHRLWVGRPSNSLCFLIDPVANERRIIVGSMRGHFRDQGGLFSYISPETRVPAGHPLRDGRPSLA